MSPRKPLGKHIPSPSNAVPPNYKTMAGIMAMWDLSDEPPDNSSKKNPDGTTNRERKLGNFQLWFGAAVCGFDPETVRRIYADGLDHPMGKKTIRTSKNTHLPPEPDNWVFREHGGDIDNVWSLRLIADHSNKHNKAANRSTMVVDQQTDQLANAHFSEVFWVKDVGVNTDDPDMFFKANAFKRGVCEGVTETQAAGGGKPTTATQSFGDRPTVSSQAAGGATEALPRTVEIKGPSRAHLCLNMNREAGFLTDGFHIGQLAHIILLRRALQTGSNRFGEPLVYAALPTQVHFYSNADQWGPLAFGVAPPGTEGLQVVGQSCAVIPLTDGEIRTGRHHWNVDTTQCMESLLHVVDKSEDGKAISRPVNQAIHVYVKIPRDTPSIGPPTEVPPDFPDIITPSFTPVADFVGPMATTRWREDKAVGRGATITIPLDIPTGEGLNIMKNVVPAQGDPLDVTRLQLDATLSKRGDDLAALIRTATAILDVPDEAAANTEVKVNWFLPHELLKDFKGGKVHLADYHRGDLAATTSAGPMNVGEWIRHFGRKIESGQFDLDVEMATPIP